MLASEWKRKIHGEDLFAKCGAMDFMEITKGAQPIKELAIDLMIRTVDYVKVYESGIVVTVFFDGTEIEYKTGT